jgi:hypothetical protein
MTVYQLSRQQLVSMCRPDPWQAFCADYSHDGEVNEHYPAYLHVMRNGDDNWESWGCDAETMETVKPVGQRELDTPRTKLTRKRSNI